MTVLSRQRDIFKYTIFIKILIFEGSCWEQTKRGLSRVAVNLCSFALKLNLDRITQKMVVVAAAADLLLISDDDKTWMGASLTF